MTQNFMLDPMPIYDPLLQKLNDSWFPEPSVPCLGGGWGWTRELFLSLSVCVYLSFCLCLSLFLASHPILNSLSASSLFPSLLKLSFSLSSHSAIDNDHATIIESFGSLLSIHVCVTSYVMSFINLILITIPVYLSSFSIQNAHRDSAFRLSSL